MPSSRAAVWLLFTTIGCDEAPAPNVSAEPLGAVPVGATSPAEANGSHGAAGEPGLSGEELERMLDALEREMQRTR